MQKYQQIRLLNYNIYIYIYICNLYIVIQGVRKIARSTLGIDSGLKKKEKKLYKHNSKISRLRVIDTFMIKKIVIYNSLGTPLFKIFLKFKILKFKKEGCPVEYKLRFFLT